MSRILISLFFLSLVFRVAHAAGQSCQALFDFQSKHQIEVALAEGAGLRYMTKSTSGFFREARGKFLSYRDAQGQEVDDPETLSRISSLKIPPAYREVWISSDPRSHIQARGIDEAGRMQYRYHPDWTTKVRDEAKYGRLQKFGRQISKLRMFVDQDLRKNKVDQDAKIAAVVRLLEVAGIRIGSDQYSIDGGSYGLATLEVRHVKVRGADVRFQFVAKEGIEQDILVHDEKIARIVNYSLKNKNPNDRLFDTSADEVNDYIKERIGAHFSAKDFRTWVGTTQAVKFLQELGEQNSEKEQTKAIVLACTQVANLLHNTPSVARNSYISPKVIEAYKNQSLQKSFGVVIDPNLSLAENATLDILAH